MRYTTASTRLLGLVGSTLIALSASAQFTGVATDIRVTTYPSSDRPLRVEIVLQIPDNMYVYASPDHSFRVAEKTSQNLGEITLQLPETKQIDDLTSEDPAARVDVFSGNSRIVVERSATGKEGEPWSFQGVLGFQGCSDTTCNVPQDVPFSFAGILGEEPLGPGEPGGADPGLPVNTSATDAAGEAAWQALAAEFEVVGRGSGYMRVGDFLAFLDAAESGGGTATESVKLEGKAPWLVIMLVLLGGLALNLTPCVLPMIPINLAIIGAGAQSGSKRRGMLLGATYGIAMALVYGVLGLVVVLTGTVFGTLNSSPWFNLGISVVFLVLALAMFDFFEIDFSRFGSSVDTNRWQKGSFLLALFMGGISALLAGACVAPALIGVLIYSAQQYGAGNYAALALPFVLGVGMALPWPFAGAGLSVLPKPGPWMTKMKYVLGVVLLVVAVVYGQKAFALAWQDAAPTTDLSGGGDIDWVHDLPTALRKAQPGERVFIDFWATWCKNCTMMDRTTLREPRVKDRLKPYIPLKFQAEKPSETETKAVLDHFGVIGLPTYVVLQRK